MSEGKVNWNDVACWVDRSIGNGAAVSERVLLNEVIGLICSHLKIRIVYEPHQLKIKEDKK